MRVINVTKNTVLAEEARTANNFFTRLVGLLNRKSLNKGEALILVPSRCIHSLFMRFPIDAIFVNREDEVVAVIKNLKPYRITPIYSGASFAIELPLGTIEFSRTAVNDKLSFTSP